MVGWFEIPVQDMERAMAFYQKVFQIEFNRQKMEEFDMAWFPWKEGIEGSPGSLVAMYNYYKPSQDGVLIYFNSLEGDLSKELSRVVDAGGEVIQEKQEISPEIGYMGLFIDSEGNRIALHSRQ